LGAFLTPGSGMGESQHPDPGWTTRSYLELRNHFFAFWRQFGSGIRDGKESDPGSGINIPDPPHWTQLWATISTFTASMSILMSRKAISWLGEALSWPPPKHSLGLHKRYHGLCK
jgi:hypothetical protein